MINKLRVPIRVQCFVIALSLAVTTTVLGLSAYLTETDTYQGTFKTVGCDDLGFNLTDIEHREDVIVLKHSSPGPHGVSESAQRPVHLCGSRHIR